MKRDPGTRKARASFGRKRKEGRGAGPRNKAARGPAKGRPSPQCTFRPWKLFLKWKMMAETMIFDGQGESTKKLMEKEALVREEARVKELRAQKSPKFSLTLLSSTPVAYRYALFAARRSHQLAPTLGRPIHEGKHSGTREPAAPPS